MNGMTWGNYKQPRIVNSTAIISVILLFYCLFCWVGLGSDDEVRLVDHLFERQGYNPLIRPVRNLTEKVEVGFNLALIQLINVVSTSIMLIIYL
jgi:hypothetical protein